VPPTNATYIAAKSFAKKYTSQLIVGRPKRKIVLYSAGYAIDGWLHPLQL
jgi:hypothetical protein